MSFPAGIYRQISHLREKSYLWNESNEVRFPEDSIRRTIFSSGRKSKEWTRREVHWNSHLSEKLQYQKEVANHLVIKNENEMATRMEA